MNEAIKLAIEKGGYNNLTVSQMEHAKAGNLREEFYVLDPLFWQALGKALGWEEQSFGYETSYGYWEGKPEWNYFAHMYFDLLLTGGDTEKFWKELLA